MSPFASSAGNPKLTAAVIVRLDDVHEMWGGHTLVLDADGNLFVRKVTGRNEVRHYLKLPPEEINALLAFMPISGILDYRERKRAGVIDEAYRRITLTLPNQKKLVADKWANDEDPQFDKLYKRLLQLVERAAKTPSYKTQQYDVASEFPGDA